MDERSEKQVIEDYLKGDAESFEVLIERNFKAIYRFIYRYIGSVQDAEDLTQDTFVKALRHFKKFDKEKSFKTWIFRIAKNTCLDFFKKKKSIPFSRFEKENGDNSILETLADPSLLPNELLEREGLGEALSGAMDKLSPKYRSVLFLRYNDHFNFREISEIFEESIHTIKSRHRRALILLKNLLT